MDVPSDASLDAPWDATSDAPSDARVDASADAPSESGILDPLSNPANWATLDTATIANPAGSYVGAIFDGRYTYFVPLFAMPYQTASGTVARYDTTAPFASASAWQSFDTTTVSASAAGLSGGAFDGRFLYLPASFLGDSTSVMRYDTRGTFSDAASWTAYSPWRVDAGTHNHAGGVFDGRYVYFANGERYSGTPRIGRFDTTGRFTDAASWSSFDVAVADPNAGGSMSGTFDGRYLYFAPNSGDGTAKRALRYDSQAPFGAAASWTSFDITQLAGGTLDFIGNVFDGRYVYYVPVTKNGSDSGLVVRYDTLTDFRLPASWTAFDVSTVDTSASTFAGGGFDGRYVYFIPLHRRHLARYDTQAPFGSASSWTTFDLQTLNANATAYWGCAFDGRALYLAPFTTSQTQNTLVLRFQARTTPMLPPTYRGSFF